MIKSLLPILGLCVSLLVWIVFRPVVLAPSVSIDTAEMAIARHGGISASVERISVNFSLLMEAGSPIRSKPADELLFFSFGDQLALGLAIDRETRLITRIETSRDVMVVPKGESTWDSVDSFTIDHRSWLIWIPILITLVSTYPLIKWRKIKSRKIKSRNKITKS